MVAADDDRRANDLRSHQFIDRQAEFRAISLPQPTNARGQSLEGNLRRSFFHPAVQSHVIRKQSQHFAVNRKNIFRVSGKRRPAKRPLAFAEQRANVRGHKSRIRKRLGKSRFQRLSAQVIAIVEDHSPTPLELNHGFRVLDHGLLATPHILLRIALAQLQRVLEAQSVRHIAIQFVMRRGLIRDHVRRNVATQDFGQYVSAIAEQADGDGLLLLRGCKHPLKRFIKTLGALVTVADLDASLETLRIHFHYECDSTIQRHGKRLRATHAAQTARQRPCAFQAARKMLGRERRKGFVGSLQNPLRANVDP